MNTKIILEYFDIKYYWKNNRPKFKFSLKENKKIKKDVPIKCIVNNKVVTQTGIKYYTHYLGDETGWMVYNERKKMFSLYLVIPWYISIFNPVDKNKLLDYIDFVKAKATKGTIESYKGEVGIIRKQKLIFAGKKYSSSKSVIMKEKWKTPEFRKVVLNRDYSYENHGKKIHDFYENNKDFIIEVMNKPERKKKISVAAKKMWEEAKLYDKDLLVRMLNSSKNKNYQIGGYKMNSIEYQIATILNDSELKWKYEEPVIFGKKYYVPDFLVGSNIVIECYGDFWHANPKFFGKDDTTHKSRKAWEVWLYDEIKRKTFETNGYLYLVFWESDIINNLTSVKEMIYEQIKK